jgi:hypothetical protein
MKLHGYDVQAEIFSLLYPYSSSYVYIHQGAVIAENILSLRILCFDTHFCLDFSR